MDNGHVDLDFNDWRKRLGRDIRDCRARLGWNQTELAKKATPVLYPLRNQHISKSTISGIEKGTGNPTMEMLNALAVALDVEIKIKLRPIDKSDTPPTNSSEIPPEPRRTPPSAEQVQALLSDIPPPGAVTNGEMGAADTADRLARIGADLLGVIEDLGSGRQAAVARGSRPERSTSHRKDRGRKDSGRAPKTTTKRR